MAREGTLLVKPISGSHDLAIFEIATQKLRQQALVLPRSFPEDYGIALMTDGAKFMLAGGAAPGTYAILPHSYIIDIVSGNVRETASLPVGMKGLRLIATQDSIYSIGGCSEGPEHIVTQNLCLLYSLRYDAWVRLADLPQAVIFPGVFLRDQEIWATGGFVRGEAGSHVMDLIQVYSMAKNEWRVLPETLLRPSYLHVCVLDSEGEMIVCCGLRDSNSNRFSYKLGKEERAILPEKISMSIVDPVVRAGDHVYVFNDEMSLLIYSSRTETWTVVLDPETLE